jgi:hypothetical protein
MAQYHEVVEEPAYTKAIAEIAQRLPRVRDVEAALAWSLARNPRQHYRVPNTRYHIVQTAVTGVPDVPTIRVLYWFDDEKVYLVSAMQV